MTIDLSNSTFRHESSEEKLTERLDEVRPYVNPADAEDRAAAALAILFSYSQIDGGHHKQWCLDQITRVLTGDRYESFVKFYTNEDAGDENELWSWDEGIAP